MSAPLKLSAILATVFLVSGNYEHSWFEPLDIGPLLDAGSKTFTTRSGQKYSLDLPRGYSSGDFLKVYMEIRWDSSLDSFSVAEKFCFDLGISDVLCHEIAEALEDVAELNDPRTPPQAPDPVLLYHVPNEKFVALPDYQYTSGPRSFQVSLELTAYQMRDTSQICGGTDVQLGPAASIWLENASDKDTRILLVEIVWMYPAQPILEVIALLTWCLEIQPAVDSMRTLFRYGIAMNRHGPSLETFHKHHGLAPYVVKESSLVDVRFNFHHQNQSGSEFTSMGWDFPNVRWSKGIDLNIGPAKAKLAKDPVRMKPPPLLPRPTSSAKVTVHASAKLDVSVAIILTVFKRDHFLEQLAAVATQSVLPAAVYVYQDENHIDILPYLAAIKKGAFDRKIELAHPYVSSLLPLPFELFHIHSSRNFKYHGRFAQMQLLSEDYIALFDDDKIPGPRWVEHALGESISRGSIIGYSGRLWTGSKWYHVPLYRIRETVPVDYVGQCWVFKSDWVRYFWRERPVSMDNGEDMQFSASALIHGGIRTFAASQPPEQPDVWCDSKPEYGVDEFSSSSMGNFMSWARERTGILNYMLLMQNFKPLLYRAPLRFLRAIGNYRIDDEGAVDNARARQLLMKEPGA